MTAVIRNYRPGDERAAYAICLKTADHGRDGEAFYRDDPDSVGRVYVGPYLQFEPELAWMLEDDQGVAGYVLGARDSRAFYDRYEQEWRPVLCAQYPDPTGDPTELSRVEQIYRLYHHPDYYCPEPYDQYPSHLHIDLLPRVQGQGYGRKMIERLLSELQDQGSPGVHLGMGIENQPAYKFYQAVGFDELERDAETIYMGLRL